MGRKKLTKVPGTSDWNPRINSVSLETRVAVFRISRIKKTSMADLLREWIEAGIAIEERKALQTNE